MYMTGVHVLQILGPTIDRKKHCQNMVGALQGEKGVLYCLCLKLRITSSSWKLIWFKELISRSRRISFHSLLFSFSGGKSVTRFNEMLEFLSAIIGKCPLTKSGQFLNSN